MQVTNDTEFIIGIDFDNEETSAFFYNLKTQDRFDLYILPGSKIIKSAVAILEQEGGQTICVGESAIQNAPFSKDFQLSFWKVPSEMNTIERNRMVAFMRGVYAEILNRYPDFKLREHVIYIACHLPYRLLKNEESDYLKIFEDAGLPIAGIQTKAVAAYFYEERQPASIFRSKGGILIADFASKYTGFTYFNCHMSQRIEDVYQFGMSEIEELLLEYALLHPQDSYMTEFAEHYGNHKESIPYNQILFAFRKAKEIFYANKLPIFSVQFDYSDLTSAGNFPINGFGGIGIPRVEVESILKGFIDHVKNAVKAFKNNILGNDNITSCVLIGEGSCMDFVRNILMDVFHLDEKQCSACERTSLMVSQGVAYKAYNDIKYPRSFNINFYNNNNMKQITPNTEFIIGIDFGHGETSAAFYNLKTQEHSDIEILPGLKVIKSAVAILEQEENETICVGEAAIQNAPIAKDFQIAFKKRPSEMNTVERNRMVAFMKGVYAEILNRHPDYKTCEHVVYIARPSQDELWEPEERAYLKIAEDAGLPVVGIQKESRAAYFRARTQPNANASTNIDNYVGTGVLIVDYGSSTIDFTYLNTHLSKPIDDGCPLGASEVERLLLEYAMSNPYDPFMPEFVKRYGNNKDSNPYNQILYAFRKAKEEFYANKKLKFTVQFDYGDLTSSENSSIEGFGGIVISKDKINEILGKDVPEGYIDRVKKAVISFKENKLKKNQVACVYLTGGASRMDFVREIFMNVFHLDEYHCPSDSDPSVIVSQGVAHLSYADIKGKEQEVELKSLAQSAISDYNWEENFRNIIYKSIKEKIITEAWSLMIAYKDKNSIVEYMTLIDGKSSTNSNEYIGMEGGVTNGFVAVRNIRALNKKFISKFTSMVHYDFVSLCEASIVKNIIASVIEKLKNVLTAFQYDSSNSEYHLKLNDLSAKITEEGVNQLSAKFTEEGEGHIIYDAVKSCYPFGMMVGWNLHKDRWDSDRKQHYEYYRNNYKNIYTSSEWDEFLKKNIIISGTESAKKQTKDYLDKLIDDYVGYAKLTKFFKKG